MNKQEKLQKLKALNESVKATKARLDSAKKLEESFRPTNIGLLLEAELEQAEVILAAKDFTSKMQKMAEELAKMQADSIPLGDSMKEIFGPEAAQDFETAVTQAIQDGLASVRTAKDQITNSISRVEGGTPEVAAEVGNDMDAMGGDELDLGGDDLGGEEPAGDVFGGADAAAGGAEEPLGRGMKESLSNYGSRVLVRESLDTLVSWLMEDVAATMPADQMPKFAGQIAARSAKNPSAMAGWIGQRKYGKGLGAQLSNPIDMDSDILDENAKLNKIAADNNRKHINNYYRNLEKEMRAGKSDDKKVEEGKSYKRNDDEDGENVSGKKKASAERGAKASAKREIEEGKSFKKNDDEDGESASGKKKASVERGEKAKSKRSIEETVRLMINRNIAQTGKGMAANAIAEAQSRFPMLESDYNINEAFEVAYGMSPQAYSLKRAKLVKEAELNQTDKKNVSGVMAKVASDMTTDKNLGNKGVQSVMSKMDSKDRATAQKVVNKAKSEGKPMQKVQDLVDATKDEIDENWNKGASRAYTEDAAAARKYQAKANAIRAKRQSDPDNPELKAQYCMAMAKYVKHAYHADGYGNMAEAKKDYNEWIAQAKKYRAGPAVAEALDENINAANWPLNSMGQYKGEPFQTDHQKLAPNKTSSDNGNVSDTPKSADEPKSDTPWDGGNKAKAESPKTSDGATASTKPARPSQDGAKDGKSAPKAEKKEESGKPWEKKED